MASSMIAAAPFRQKLQGTGVIQPQPAQQVFSDWQSPVQVA
jgi:hypothetical protein